jgi:hypothetical protein
MGPLLFTLPVIRAASEIPGARRLGRHGLAEAEQALQSRRRDCVVLRSHHKGWSADKRRLNIEVLGGLVRLGQPFSFPRLSMTNCSSPVL